jgi:hypothetical protein
VEQDQKNKAQAKMILAIMVRPLFKTELGSSGAKVQGKAASLFSTH